MKRSVVFLTIIFVLFSLACTTQQDEQSEREAEMKKELAKIKYDVPDEPDVNYDVLDKISVKH